MGRSALSLEEYAFTIAYKLGKHHTAANCLSRHPLPVAYPQDIDCDVIEHPVLPLSGFLSIEEQRRDPALSTFIDDLSRGTPTSSYRFFASAIVLYADATFVQQALPG